MSHSSVATSTPDTRIDGFHAVRVEHAFRVRFEASLDYRLAATNTHPNCGRLNAAMRYAALGGGKRMRPLLVHAASQLVELPESLVLACAVAVESIHVYSLIHDDLPAMDDDALRRGKATCHIAFDEATAILAGDALQAMAFDVIATAFSNHPEADLVGVVRTLARAAGQSGMAGGQMIDLLSEGRELSLDALETMHRLKTGALIEASAMLPLIAARAPESTLQSVRAFADSIGLAFQVRDDLLDVEGDSHLLGKATGADAAHAKATFPSLIGMEASRRRLETLHANALAALERFGDTAEPLRHLARRIVERTH